MESSRHTPCAVRHPIVRFSGRHTECACYYDAARERLRLEYAGRHYAGRATQVSALAKRRPKLGWRKSAVQPSNV